MHNYSLGSMAVTKGKKLSKDQCPKNDRERITMKIFTILQQCVV